MIRLSFFMLSFTILSSMALAGQDDILIADFEGSDYGNWHVTGEAFGSGPAQGTLPSQMEVSGYRGRGLVNSYYGGDGTTGKATSPAFTIQRKFVNFLIGGGMNPGQTCMNLVVDGKTARTATGPNDKPGGSEELSWASWDVTDLVGKQAILEIVDTHTGGWGHINVDHIFQSDEDYAAPVPDLKRTITLSKAYLNFPVTTGAPKRLMRMYVGDTLVREFMIEYAEADEQFWVFTETGQFQGRTVTFVLPGDREGDPEALGRITQTDVPAESDTFYKERLRPQVHFSSRRGWNNDSNGMVYYKGEYHLFYQHNPYGWPWGNMTWGHAVSTDMIHWRELGDALHPDHLGTIFSGSAVVDHKNTAGFQNGDEKTIVCMYTSAGGTNPWSEGKKFTQSIAYSNDRGRTWTMYENNPVVDFIANGNRDPKVIWHEPSGQWAMVLYLDGKDLGFFTSKDLKTWEFQSKLVGFFECPELFELAVDGDDSNKKWIVYGASGDYMVGTFDGKRFEPDGDLIRFHYGNCFYASQTFNNVPEEDGRRIQIAWGRVATPGMPFNQCMLFPVELTLRGMDEGPQLFVNPIRELQTLHGKTHTWANVVLPAEKDILSSLSGDLFHIEAEFEVGQAKRLGFVIRGVEMAYDVQKGQLSCLDKTAPLEAENGRIKLEILVDRTTIEIFANDGRIYMPIGVIPDQDNRSMKVFGGGGKARLESLAVHELASVWQTEPGPPTASTGMTWRKVPGLSDEFNAAALDRDKWIDWHPYWKGRDSRFEPENVSVAGGCLQLKSTLRPDATEVNPETVTAACLSSKKPTAGYGYYEARVRASGLCMTSSFWFQGKYSEIDVVEQIGRSKKTPPHSQQMRMNTHYFARKDGQRQVQSTPVNWVMPCGSADAFHVYGLWWRDDRTAWFYHNGVKVAEATFKTDFREPMYMFFDTEVFEWEGWPGGDELKDSDRNTMLVDWVRSYKLVRE